MKRLLSILLSVTILLTLIVPGSIVLAEDVTYTYLAIDCTDPENSTASFAEQAYNQNGQDPNNEGTFSRFDATGIGDIAVYKFNVETAGVYDFSIRYRPHESTGVADIYINDVKLDQNFPQSGSPNSPQNIDYGKVEFKEGENTVKFIITAKGKNNYRLNIFKFMLSVSEPAKEPVGENDGIPIGEIGGAYGAAGTLSGDTVTFSGPDAFDADFSSVAQAEQTTGGKTFSRFEGAKMDDYATYIIHADAAGTYDLQVTYRAHESVGKAYLYVNGAKQEEPFKSTGAYNSYYTRSLGIHNLVEGDNYIQFKMYEAGSSGTYKLNIVSFQLAAPSEEELNGYEKTFDGASSEMVEAYPLWSIYDRSSIFSVTADGVDVPVIAYNSDWYDYAQFSFKKDGPVEIIVTYNKEITSYSISPLKLGIEGKVEGNKLTFTMEKDEYLIIRLNGSSKRLVITADPPQTDVPASSGEGIFNITDEAFGADPTGKDSSYDALKAAITAAGEYGNTDGNEPGIVYVPDGVYFTGSLMLPSNVKLYLAPGAILRASRSENDFVEKGRKNSLGLPITYLIYTDHDTENITVYGRGTVDGNGSYVRSLGFALQTLAPINTTHFTTDGITYRDSGMWSIVPAWSDHLEFLNMKMLNTVKLGEDDGIDICGCQEVLVQNAIGIMWDDPYTTKSYTSGAGEIAGGWGHTDASYGEVNENIVFDDCISWTGCYGFKAGQGFFFDHQNVTFQNGTVYECAVGLGVHFKQGTAKAQDITFQNIDIESIPHQNDDHKTWFVAYIQSTSGGEAPTIDGVTVKNINVRSIGSSIPKLKGLEKDGNIHMVRNVSFENITFQGSTGAATTLYQMGFRDTNSENSENCYVVNPAYAKTPAEYFASGGAKVSDAAAETAQAAQIAAGAAAHYPDIDFGADAQRFEVRLNAAAEGTLSVHLDDAASDPIGTVALNGEGEYTVAGFDLTGITGVHDVYLKADQAVTVDWFRPYAETEPQPDEDAIAAKAVDELIAALGEITALEQKADVAAARAAYDGLNADAKALVEKLDILLSAEAAIKALEKAAAQPEYDTGDVDRSGTIDVADIMKLKALIMADKWSEAELTLGDLDSSKALDVGDIMAVKNIIMSK